MALKITVKHHGQDVILEGDAKDVVDAARSLLDAEKPKPRVSAAVAPDMFGPRQEKVAAAPATRAPRGENKKFVLKALADLGQGGGLQAEVKKVVSRDKEEDVPVSSVRHALKQLQEVGHARRDGDVWRITSSGISALAKLEAA